MAKRRELSIAEIRKLVDTKGRRRLLTRREAGRLAAYYNNAKPFRMTPKRLEARKKGGVPRGKQRTQESRQLRNEQYVLLVAARQRLTRKLRRQPTYEELAKATGKSTRTVRRVRAWWRRQP